MKFHDWTTAVAPIGQVTHIRVCHQYMCVIIPTQFIDYLKVILDKGAIIIMQIKEVAMWSKGTCNRTHLVAGNTNIVSDHQRLGI